jgi:hypothetical protein
MTNISLCQEKAIGHRHEGPLSRLDTWGSNEREGEKPFALLQSHH